MRRAAWIAVVVCGCGGSNRLDGYTAPCDLQASPAPVGFGNVAPDGGAVATLTLMNAGTGNCALSELAVGAGADAGFALALAQPTALTLAPSASAAVSLTFQASAVSAPTPFSGELVFDTGLPAVQSSVALSAVVDPLCANPQSQKLYTVDGLSGVLSSFDPLALAFTDIGALVCPGAQPDDTPYSMAIDQAGTAWVLFDTGKLYEVDIATAACQATDFVAGQQGFDLFGMSFLSDPATGADTLYIAGGAWGGANNSLGTVGFPSLSVQQVAPLTVGWSELAGTGDGQLWAFAPGLVGFNGVAEGTPSLAQIDPATGAMLSQRSLPQIQVIGVGYSMKFWGGSFWVFMGSQVYEVPRATGVPSLRVQNNGRQIAGAAGTTCAPLD